MAILTGADCATSDSHRAVSASHQRRQRRPLAKVEFAEQGQRRRNGAASTASLRTTYEPGVGHATAHT